MQRFLDAGAEWRNEDHVTDEQQQQRMRLSYRVICDVTFYGPGCDRLCVPRDDLYGHYDCDASGRRVCHVGWNGTYCDTG